MTHDLISRLESGSGDDMVLNIDIARIDPEMEDGMLIPAYTSSLDAALSLVERMLPGSFYFLGKGKLKPDEPLFAAQIYKARSIGDEALLGEAEHVSSQACALLIALLRALDQEPQT